MNLSTVFFVALGLSMDAFAVSISSGARTRQRLLRQAFIIALCFGGFQALMPALGWMAGLGLRHLIQSVDHWIAFGLLTLLGCKMIYDTFSPRAEKGREEAIGSMTLSLLLTLALATSIDALVVGFSLSVVQARILLPIAIIGAVTFVISGAGVLLGHRFGKTFGRKFEFAGGVLLIAIGFKILLDHTLLAPGTVPF